MRNTVFSCTECTVFSWGTQFSPAQSALTTVTTNWRLRISWLMGFVWNPTQIFRGILNGAWELLIQLSPISHSSLHLSSPVVFNIVVFIIIFLFAISVCRIHFHFPAISIGRIHLHFPIISLYALHVSRL